MNTKITVLRQCRQCKAVKEQEDFTYLGDCVWQCGCGSMYTDIYEMIDLNMVSVIAKDMKTREFFILDDMMLPRKEVTNE